MGEGSNDFSTSKTTFMIILVLFARECLKNGLVSVAPSPSMSLSTNVDSALLSLTIDSAGFYCEREKNPLLTVNIERLPSTTESTFSPHMQAISSESLSKHIFFLSTKERRREQAKQTIIVGSLQTIHMTVWVWVWVSVGVSG